MNWKEFIEATNKTAFYPDAGQKTPTEFAYVALGLAGEAGELLRAPNEKARREEIGDCFWYLARAHLMLDGLGPTDPSTRYLVPSRHITLSALTLGNVTKKVLRDGGLTRELEDSLRRLYLDSYLWLRRYAIESSSNPDCLDEIFDEVMEKLRSRKERGVLGGSGDNR